MLVKSTKLFGFDIDTVDGSIGHVDDMLFDSEWTTRYLIVDTGPWFFGKRVLVSTAAIKEPSLEAGVVSVDLTKEQIENSPDIDATQPVTREHEIALHDYYQWPAYWAPTGAPGGYGMSGTPLSQSEVAPSSPETATVEAQALRRAESEQQALHSIQSTTGHNIIATDGEIGHVSDFFIDEADWKIRYMLVDTGSWLPGRKVIISPDWVAENGWDESGVRVKLSQAQVKDSPEYDPTKAVDRDYEATLYSYYGFPMY